MSKISDIDMFTDWALLITHNYIIHSIKLLFINKSLKMHFGFVQSQRKYEKFPKKVIIINMSTSAFCRLSAI